MTRNSVVSATSVPQGANGARLTGASVARLASLLGTPDRGAVLIALNLRDEALEADVTVRGRAAGEARDLIAGQTVTMEDGGRLKLAFGPYESRVLWLQE